ncbi:MAG TPA: hypothetical protein VGO56_19165 [Pyrinomonadaceae bacterium]|nr:hypothetical protein [Pyrinomonadaceae bacterium]
MNRCLYKILIIVGLCLTATFSYSQVSRFTPTAEDINARLAQLAEPEKNIPDSEIMLYEEKRRSEDEIEKYKAFSRTQEESSKESITNLNSLKSSTDKFFQDLAGLNCSSLDEKKLTEVLGNLSTIQRNIFLNFDDPDPSQNPWEIELGTEGEKPTKPQTCQKLKDLVGIKKQELTADIETRSGKIAKTQEEKKKLQDLAGLLIQALQKRQAALQNKLSSKDSQQAISSSLWLIILAIGALSIGTILTIKLFSQELQIEWVTSGQVIQFVTVMILLSVVMALGLANILKENTLGTLLGGIAGYVLSQGVGRAAAREVSRRLHNQQDGEIGVSSAGSRPTSAVSTDKPIAPTSSVSEPVVNGSSVNKEE